METLRPSVVPRWVTGILGGLWILSIAVLNYGNYAGGASPGELAVNTILLAIPTGLLFSSIWLFTAAHLQRREQGRISGKTAKMIYWMPRVAGVVIAIFVGLFALDVFEGEASIWQKMLAFLIHAMPAISLSVIAALAWKRDWLGCVVFGLAALLFLYFLLPNPLEQFGVVLLFSGPLAMISLMYWVNWKWRQTG